MRDAEHTIRSIVWDGSRELAQAPVADGIARSGSEADHHVFDRIGWREPAGCHRRAMTRPASRVP
jgi:hypothetical protein